jgi:hypothetical protein
MRSLNFGRLGPMAQVRADNLAQGQLGALNPNIEIGAMRLVLRRDGSSVETEATGLCGMIIASAFAIVWVLRP